MNARVNIEHLKYASQDMCDISEQAAKLLPELAEAEAQIKKQEQLRSFLPALGVMREDLRAEKCRLSELSLALLSIEDQYRGAEMKAEGEFGR